MEKEIHKIKNVYMSNKIKNKKYKLIRKRMKLRICAGIAALILLFSAGIRKYIDNENSKAETAIVQYYGQESTEKNIFDYTMISNDLHNLNLDSYQTSEELFDKCDVSKELLSPTEIQELIERYKSLKIYIPNNSLVRDYDRVALIMELINQERKVNEYLYGPGLDTTYANAEDAVKEYAGEAYGVKPESITFDYKPAKDGDEPIVNINIINENDEVIHSKLISGWGNREIKNDIIDGVIHMDNTDKRFDPDETDNDQYNATRNRRIIDSLKASSELFSKVENEDLFSKKLNEDLFGKSK